MSKENSSRPRRAGANYGPMPPPRDPLLSIPLSLKRKTLIMDFKKGHTQGLHSDKWLQNLFQFMSSKDGEILIEDVKRWVDNHSWITTAGGQPPEALKMLNKEGAPSTSAVTPEKKAPSSSTARQATSVKIDKKVTFKTPELEVRHIQAPTQKSSSKVKLPKPSPGYFSKNN